MPALPILPAYDRDQAEGVGRAAADATFDYTEGDMGMRQLHRTLEQSVKKHAPVIFPAGPTERDSAEYVRWVGAARRKRTTVTWWAISGATAVTIWTWVVSPSSTAYWLMPALSIVFVAVMRGTTQDPDTVPKPPTHADPRQGTLERAWRATALEAAKARREELMSTRTRLAYGPRPTARGWRLTYAEAERVAGAWMAFMGAKNMVVSQATRDGGIDVSADGFVAQVKWQATPVSPGPLHQIFGVAQATRPRAAKALFFAASGTGYSKEARKFADQIGMALFTLSDDGGTLNAVNEAAEIATRQGLPAFWR